MANTLITSDMIAKEGMRLLKNNLTFTRGVNRKVEKEFNSDIETGDTVNVKLPAQYTVRSGATAQVQDHVAKKVPVTLDTQKGVDVNFSSKELALSMKKFSAEVLAPQIALLANEIDLDGLKLYKKVANAVGTPGTIPSAIKTYASAGAKMDMEACPMDEQRNVVLDPLAQVEIIDSLKGLFQSSNQIKQQYERGKMGTAAGFDWSMSQNIATHLVGPYAGTPLVNGASQAGSSIVADGFTGSALQLKQGDVITFAGVYAVNPISKQSTNQLRQFVVTADVTSSAGAASIGIYPAIVTSGAYQNVTAAPADNAAITVLGAAGAVSPTHLAYHKDAFTLVTAELPLPNGMDMKSRETAEDLGLSLRFIRGYDITNDKFVSRFDVLYGWAALRPEWACRIQG